MAAKIVGITLITQEKCIIRHINAIQYSLFNEGDVITQ